VLGWFFYQQMQEYENNNLLTKKRVKDGFSEFE